MADIPEKYLSIVKEILSRFVPDCEVRVFGSRVQGKARQYSDLDLAIVGSSKLPDALIYDMKEAFAESDLPWRVDVLDWWAITAEFREVIERKGFEVL